MSRRIDYHKLVRDKIPEIIESDGKSCEVEVLSESDYKTFLFDKLLEEVNEFFVDDSIEELADVTEVIHAILKLKGKTAEDLEDVRAKKLKERGGFEKRLLLKRVDERPLPASPKERGKNCVDDK